MYLHSICPSNLLSFGPDTREIELTPLNILIGPNGSGKSNFIEAICLIRGTASDLQQVVRKGGGVREWIWKGGSANAASVETVAEYFHQPDGIRHRIEFTDVQQTAAVLTERIEASVLRPEIDTLQRYYDLTFIPASVTLMGKPLPFTTVDRYSSILTQRRDPEQYPQITYLAEQYSMIRVYREWAFGRNTVFREPQRADMRSDRLEEDFSNLGLVLNRLRRNPQAKKMILSYLRDLYEGIDDFDVIVEGGTVQVFFTEGEFTIPATRLSDGTLRYLCLLAILCDPMPAPLICIEEPELGLHPDLLPKIADLLIEASQRSQLIITTHSDILVNAMTDQPESILVCEKRLGQTHLERLSTDNLSVWLEKYRLGELWIRGELGGTRW